MIDFRNLYVKELTSYRGKGRRIKIGIARNMARRHAQVEAGLPGSVVSLFHRRLFFARKTEKYLHDKYRLYHTPVKNLKRGAGGSEIFTISTAQLAVLRLILWAYSLADVFISFTLLAIACKIIYALWFLIYQI